MGHYDLYGNSYRTAQEALNAEMAQCAEIDSQITQQETKNIQQQVYELQQHCYRLEQRIEQLELKLLPL